MKVTITETDNTIAGMRPGQVFVHPWTDGSWHAYLVIAPASIDAHFRRNFADCVYAVDLASGQINRFAEYSTARPREAEVFVRD